MTDDTFTTEDGCRLGYEVRGKGMPVLWQHGLGADRGQPAEVFPDMPGVRRITLECRGHGASDLGEPDAISIARFADDALAFLEHLGIEKAVVGGISLGAAIALRLAANHPERVDGLILARPAWVDEVGPDPMQAHREVADLITRFGPDEGRRVFAQSPRLKAIEALSPDNAASLRWFFGRPRPDTTVALLSRIPAQGPDVPRDRIADIETPTLVVANGEDAIHPLATAKTLADLIPGAELKVITSKTVSRELYVSEFKAAIGAFLAERGFA